VHACMRAFVRACVRSCVRACVRACVRMRVLASVGNKDEWIAQAIGKAIRAIGDVELEVGSRVLTREHCRQLSLSHVWHFFICVYMFRH
jgi:hypothetical protein